MLSLPEGAASLELAFSTIFDYNGNNNTDVVWLSPMPILAWVVLLHLFCERTIPPGVETCRFRFSRHRKRNECLQRVVLRLAQAASFREVAQMRAHNEFLSGIDPSAKSSHVFPHNGKHILRAQIVPDAIGCEHKNVSVFHFVVRHCRVLGCLGVLKRTSEELHLGEYQGGNFGHLVRGVEGMRLRRGEVADGIEAEMDEA